MHIDRLSKASRERRDKHRRIIGLLMDKALIHDPPNLMISIEKTDTNKGWDIYDEILWTSVIKVLIGHITCYYRW